MHKVFRRDEGISLCKFVFKADEPDKEYLMFDGTIIDEYAPESETKRRATGKTYIPYSNQPELFALSHNRTRYALCNERELWLYGTSEEEPVMVAFTDNYIDRFYPAFSVDDSELYYNTRIEDRRYLMAYNIAENTERIVYGDEAYSLIQVRSYKDQMIIGKLYHYGRGKEVSLPLVIFNEADGSFTSLPTEDVTYFDVSKVAERCAYLNQEGMIVVLDLNTKSEIGRTDTDYHYDHAFPDFNPVGTMLVCGKNLIQIPSMSKKIISAGLGVQPHFNYGSTRLTSIIREDNSKD
jgi:hypothetical protein